MTNCTQQTQNKFCETPGKQWFVLRVTYHRAQKAYDSLTAHKDIEVYMPLRYTIRNIAGHNRRIVVPLLPNLLFVYADPVTLDGIIWLENRKPNTQNYITYYFDHFRIGNDGKNPPLTVPYNAMMNFIRLTSINNEHIRLVRPYQCHYRSGDIVRIIDGEFCGITGRVARVAGQQRVVVSLEGVCLVTTAYIPSGFIEKIQ